MINCQISGGYLCYATSRQFYLLVSDKSNLFGTQIIVNCIGKLAHMILWDLVWLQGVLTYPSIHSEARIRIQNRAGQLINDNFDFLLVRRLGIRHRFATWFVRSKVWMRKITTLSSTTISLCVEATLNCARHSSWHLDISANQMRIDTLLRLAKYKHYIVLDTNNLQSKSHLILQNESYCLKHMLSDLSLIKML